MQSDYGKITGYVRASAKLPRKRYRDKLYIIPLVAMWLLTYFGTAHANDPWLMLAQGQTESGIARLYHGALQHRRIPGTMVGATGMAQLQLVSNSHAEKARRSL